VVYTPGAMMEFEITDPSGRKFIVTAPEGATQDQVLEYAKQNSAREQGRTANAAAPIGDNTQRAVIGGLTFGLADEFNAGVRSAVQAIPGMRGSDRTFSERYNENLELERNRNRAFRQDNPVTATIAELGGGIVGPGLAMAPAQAGAGLMARLLRGGTSRGVVAGGTSGALAGFGEGEGGLSNRAENAANMAGLGAALGGTLGAGVSLAGKVGGRVLDAFGLRNPEIAGERQMLRALDRGGRSVADVEVPLMRPDTVMADVGGKPMQNLTAVAANTPSEAMEIAERFVNSRRYARPDRVAGDVDRFMGGGGGTAVADEIGNLRATRSANAAPLYEAAFSKPTGVTDDLRVLLEDPIVKSALEKGREVQSREMRVAGRRPSGDVGNDPSIQFDENGVARLVGTPSTRTLDAVKRGLDEILEQYRDPTTLRMNLTDDRARSLDSMRKRLVNLMDQGNPDYAAARAAYAGPSQSMDAISLGRRALTMDRDELAKAVERISSSDMEFVLLGLGRAITDKSSDPRNAPDFVRRLFEDRQMQARLATVMPDEAARTGFINRLMEESNFVKTERAVSPSAGSQTARLLAGGSDMATDPGGGTLQAAVNAATGNFGAATRNMASSMYRRSQGINNSTADYLAGRLLSDDPAEKQALIKALTNRQMTDEFNARARANMMSQILRGGAVTISGDGQSR
jgi:hypothetical protein